MSNTRQLIHVITTNYDMNNFQRIIAAVLFCVLTLEGCAKRNGSEGRNLEEEQKVIKILKLKKDNKSPIGLQEIGSGSLLSLCFQGPYLSKENFESAIGKKVDTYSEVADDVYAWWFFEENRNYWILVPRVDVSDKSKSIDKACYLASEWNMKQVCDLNCQYLMERK